MLQLYKGLAWVPTVPALAGAHASDRKIYMCRLFSILITLVLVTTTLAREVNAKGSRTKAMLLGSSTRYLISVDIQL